MPPVPPPLAEPGSPLPERRNPRRIAVELLLGSLVSFVVLPLLALLVSAAGGNGWVTVLVPAAIGAGSAFVALLLRRPWFALGLMALPTLVALVFGGCLILIAAISAT
jgi:hypothetical protein